MHKQIFVNLPVSDLRRSMTFFKALGLSFEPKFTNEQAACLILGENIYAMLLVKDLLQVLHAKSLCDAQESTEVLVGLSCESRAEVDALVAKALAAGGQCRARRRITASCTRTASRISTATSGSWCYMDPNGASAAG